MGVSGWVGWVGGWVCGSEGVERNGWGGVRSRVKRGGGWGRRQGRGRMLGRHLGEREGTEEMYLRHLVAMRFPEGSNTQNLRDIF